MKLASAIAALALSGSALAQGWAPTRPVELVVHTGPGGGSDVLARQIALIMEQEKLVPVRVQVANKPGGGGTVAAAYLAEKKGEEHTIGLFTGVWLTNPLTIEKANVTLKDLTPIVRLVLEPAVIAVKNDAPYKTLADFIAAAKAKPGELKQSGGSITSRDNVVRQQIQKVSGARWQFISFPGGGERIAALLGGHVNMMVIEPAEAESHPNANVVTRAVGATEQLRIDRVGGALQPGDTFLLASDGLTRLVRDGELSASLAAGDPERAADELLDLALARGAPDNVSLVIVRFTRRS